MSLTTCCRACGNALSRANFGKYHTHTHTRTPGPMRPIHYKPFAWAATACRRSPLKYRALVTTVDPNEITCNDCTSFIQRAIGNGGMDAEALREITAITLDIATKQDIAALRAYIDNALRDLTETLSGATPPKFMTVDECAVYLGRTPGAIRSMVERQQIPYAKVGGRLTFDPAKLTRWVQRKSRRAFET